MSPIFASSRLAALGVQYLALLCALPLVIAAEFIVARRMLKLGPARAAAALIPANIVSLLVIFPLLGLLLFVIHGAVGGGSGHGGLVNWVYELTLRVPWLVPHGRDASWMVPAASLYLLVPAFFASVFVERWICVTFWRDLPKNRLRRFSWYAHFASYSVLFVAVAVYYLIRVKLG